MIIIEFFAALVCVTIIIYYYFKYSSNRNNYDKVSFKEALDLCDLPVITFINNGIKLNFLLDTGANKSVISCDAFKLPIEYNKSDKSGTIFGMEGNAREVSYINMDISYKNKVFNDTFQVLDMSAAFDRIKKNDGVTLHGVLSHNFFQKYKYVLDFDELIAYSKK